MSSRLESLTSRRRVLVARSEALRSDLEASTYGLRRSLRIGQLGAAALGALRRHPALTVGVGVAMLAAGPARVARLAGLGLGAWSLFGRVRRIVALLGSMKRPD